jgi:general stress protein 26
MDDKQALRDRLGDLFESQRLGVLSTHRSGQPYASLIAFYATRDLKSFYFLTPRTTRKFQNLISDPRVAILVNSSTNQDCDFHQAIAVTMVGDASELVVAEHRSVMESYLAKHPYLEDFARSPTTALIEVTAKSYFLVQNFQNVTELHLNP